MDTLHHFEFALHSVPVGFHILSVDCGPWIYKMEGVVDRVVGPDRRQLLYTVLSSPLIPVYCRPTPEMTLQYWQEGCCSAVRNNCHDTECWCLTCVTHPENPHLLTWRTPTVVLEEVKCNCLCNISHIIPTLGL